MEIARRSASIPSAAPDRISSFPTIEAPGHGPDAHHPTATAETPLDAATSQKARLVRSLAETGALETNRSFGPRRRRYQDVPSGGRRASGAPRGRTLSRARTAWREAGTPVARSLQTS